MRRGWQETHQDGVASTCLQEGKEVLHCLALCHALHPLGPLHEDGGAEDEVSLVLPDHVEVGEEVPAYLAVVQVVLQPWGGVMTCQVWGTSSPGGTMARKKVSPWSTTAASWVRWRVGEREERRLSQWQNTVL